MLKPHQQADVTRFFEWAQEEIANGRATPRAGEDVSTGKMIETGCRIAREETSDIAWEEREPGYLKSNIVLYGVTHHVEAFQVVTHGAQQVCCGGDIAKGLFSEYAEVDSVYRTTSIPLFAGEWAIFIRPHAR